MLILLLTLKKQEQTKKYTDCLLCAQLSGSHSRKPSLAVTPHTSPFQRPRLLGPGLLHLRGVGVCPGCNCPLCSRLKHVLWRHHDIELTCSESGG